MRQTIIQALAGALAWIILSQLGTPSTVKRQFEGNEKPYNLEEIIVDNIRLD